MELTKDEIIEIKQHIENSCDMYCTTFMIEHLKVVSKYLIQPEFKEDIEKIINKFFVLLKKEEKETQFNSIINLLNTLPIQDTTDFDEYIINNFETLSCFQYLKQINKANLDVFIQNIINNENKIKCGQSLHSFAQSFQNRLTNEQIEKIEDTLIENKDYLYLIYFADYCNRANLDKIYNALNQSNNPVFIGLFNKCIDYTPNKELY